MSLTSFELDLILDAGVGELELAPGQYWMAQHLAAKGLGVVETHEESGARRMTFTLSEVGTTLICPDCRGNGTVDGTNPCSTCDGTGAEGEQVLAFGGELDDHFPFQPQPRHPGGSPAATISLGTTYVATCPCGWASDAEHRDVEDAEAEWRDHVKAATASR